jgi:hypothetical protein
LTYHGDQRGILDAANNPNPLGQYHRRTPLGVVTQPGDNRRGPETIYGKPGGMLWPVSADYDPVADTTRVGFSYLPPSEGLR